MTISGVPRLPSWTLSRPRLTSRFDGPESIVYVRAPAGYGKTIAMADWASTTAVRGVWMSVRGDVVESAEFVQLLAHEIQLAGLLTERDPLRWVSEAISGGADPWRLLRTWLRCVSGRFVIAVDGVDGLNPDIQRGLIELIRELPAIDLRATSRRRSVLDEPALAMTMDLVSLGTDDLALTAEEAAAVMSVDPASEAVSDVVAHGGAPLFAKLIESSGRRSRSQPAVPGDTLPDLVDSLIRLRFENTSSEEPFLRFVTATAVAESLDVDLARTLLDTVNGDEAAGTGDRALDQRESIAALLDRAEAEGLGLWNCSTSPSATFSYTPLVRDAFERRLRAVHPDVMTDLRRAVARWEFGAGRPFSALRGAVQADDWAFASRVVRSNWNELLRNHGPQLREVFRGTPLAVLRQYPFVTTLLAMDYNRTGRHRMRALEYFALARYAARTQRASASPADRAVLRAIETAGLRVSGQFTAALEPALAGYDALLSMSPADRDDLGRTEPTLLNQFGTTFFYAERTDDALAAFSRSTAVGDALGLKAGLQGLALSAGTHAVAGDIPQARALLEEAAALEWPEGWLDGYMGSFFQLAEAICALEEFDADKAEQHIRLLDPHRETIEHWPLLAHVDALILLLRGQPDRARFRIEAEARAQHRRRAVGPQTAVRLARTRSLIELAAGNPNAAEQLLGQRPSSRPRVGLARISLMRNKPQEALRHLLRGAGSDTAGCSARTTAEDLVVRAGALALAGERRRAVEAVGTAFEFLATHQQGLALALVPSAALDAILSLADENRMTLGKPFTPGQIPRMLPGGRPSSAFTPRELALIRALPASRSNSELARELSISSNTVKTQLRGLYRKLNVSSRSEAVAALAAMGAGAFPPQYEASPGAETFE